MTKITRQFVSIEKFRPKAVKIRLDETDLTAVWFPLHRIVLDENNKTISATPKLWEQKDVEKNVDMAAEAEKRKAYQNAMIPIGEAEITESGKAGWVECFVEEEITDQTSRRRAYFPVSMMETKNGQMAVPRWLLRAKAKEAVYNFASHSGRKGIRNLGGAFFTARIGDESVTVGFDDLVEEERRANK